MVASLPDLSTVYDPKSLAEILMKMLASIPQMQLSEHKIHTIKEIVHTQLFSRYSNLPSDASTIFAQTSYWRV